MKEFTIDLHDGRGNQVYVLKIDQLAALAEKDENTVSCVDYKQLTCSLCTQQKKEIAALEAVVKERNLEWESIRGQNIRHATVNDELKERIAALTAERDRLLKIISLMYRRGDHRGYLLSDIDIARENIDIGWIKAMLAQDALKQTEGGGE